MMASPHVWSSVRVGVGERILLFVLQGPVAAASLKVVIVCGWPLIGPEVRKVLPPLM